MMIYFASSRDLVPNPGDGQKAISLKRDFCCFALFSLDLFLYECPALLQYGAFIWFRIRVLSHAAKHVRSWRLSQKHRFIVRRASFVIVQDYLP